MSEADERTLSTGDLELRPWQSADSDEILRAFTDPAIRHYAGNLVDTGADVRLFLQRRELAWDDGSGASWAVTTAATGTVLGSVALHVVDANLHLATVGYWLLPRARGRGVATAAVLAATAYGFGPLGLHRVELLHDVDNLASCALAERAGYRFEGTLREAMRYPVDGRWSDEHLHARIAGD